MYLLLLHHYYRLEAPEAQAPLPSWVRFGTCSVPVVSSTWLPGAHAWEAAGLMDSLADGSGFEVKETSGQSDHYPTSGQKKQNGKILHIYDNKMISA